MAFENRVLHQEFQVRPPPPPQIEPSQISCFHSRSARARLLLSKKKTLDFFRRSRRKRPPPGAPHERLFRRPRVPRCVGRRAFRPFASRRCFGR
jgi:hypothetical protein